MLHIDWEQWVAKEDSRGPLNQAVTTYAWFAIDKLTVNVVEHGVSVVTGIVRRVDAVRGEKMHHSMREYL